MSPVLATEYHSPIFSSLRFFVAVPFGLCVTWCWQTVSTVAMKQIQLRLHVCYARLPATISLCHMYSSPGFLRFSLALIHSFGFQYKRLCVSCFSNIGRVTPINNELVPNKTCLRKGKNQRRRQQWNELWYSHTMIDSWFLNWNNIYL